MRFVFVSTSTFESWDWTNPDTRGIGGSETSHIEMCRRLAEHGHDVTSYAPIPLDVDHGPAPAGVPWFHCASIDITEEVAKGPAVWVVYRDPEFAMSIPEEAGPVWLICQDVDYFRNQRGGFIKRPFTERLTRLVGLCETHGIYLRQRHPNITDRVSISSNGIKRAIVEEVLANPPERNPKRLMFASSPDRGLLPLLSIFERAREVVSDLELHIYYGLNNMDIAADRAGEKHPIAKNVQQVRDAIQAAVEKGGVTWHGRTPQRELAYEWAKAGIWCHPTIFTETSCITSMDAQALGAIPISCPTWAIGENVRYGVFVDGDPAMCPLTRARFALELIRMALDPVRQETIRGEMMQYALNRFDWENFVEQWQSWAMADLAAESTSAASAVREPEEVLA